MADTLIEQTRSLHEDAEKLERIIVKDLKQESRTHKEKLMQNHRVRKRVQDIQQAARKLLKIYEDEDRSRKEEIDALGGEDKVFSRFYDRLKEVRDYHRRFPTMDITEAEKDDELLKEEVHVEFTGEEGMGRYLDLHEHYHRFVNGKFGRQLEYLDYLGVVVSDFGAIPRAAKFNRQYKEYLEQLLAYLTSFYERTLPLGQLRKQLQKVEDELRAAWEQGQVAGWEDRGMGQLPTGNGIVDLEAFESAEELETIGAERLKEALQALGLKCGGTPRERAERLFSTKGKPQEALDKKLFSKATAPAVLLQRSEEDAKKQQAAALQIALLEAQVAKLGEVLAGVLAETKGRVEKKQAQTYEEMQAEQEEAEHEAAPAEDDDEEDDYIYNPLKLPLGWDGKPIPYWLYKLHGLNQEFKCEICGNYSYWGRRAYEKHFKEWRHQNGMRALGIPNNKNFFEVTRIEEALSLWKAMQERQKGGFRADLDEEFEDASGNVYNRKTYEDMKRQGLL